MLDERYPPQIVWLTGVNTEVVGEDGNTAMSSDFFCHSNLVFSASAGARNGPNAEFTPVPDGRLATLVPGLVALTLPAGFGIPVYSDEELDYFTMALNLNEKDNKQLIRFRTMISFMPQSALGPAATMRPLTRRAIYGHEHAETTNHHVALHEGMPAENVADGHSAAFHVPLPRSQDASRTIHWLVAPGMHETRTEVTEQLSIAENTTIHFVTAHLHPYARSVSLVDKTSGLVIVTIRSKDYRNRRGVETMETWESEADAPVFRDHKYELLTVYDNPTSQPIDAMSILYIYLLDKEFFGNRLSTGTVDRSLTQTFGEGG